ncbi:hypothetical protein JDV02_000430 [Purpureocillium takamizusanense]|uniref:Uncharacterized protein n=1 Tax=Purpureocillium takamizusanense TaxID=2060973 RepID=A0A9Q8Q756_9HYPO|nr:uncharacterized protein JDV02_000430 [Purpureocillium takamizusanense]UNI13711.1 hypothetical protein JDV02_000430 [Purpureocillium takamizusanense]
MTVTTPIRFDIHRNAFAYHYSITAHNSTATDTALYYCDVTRFTKSSTPDMVLYAGSSPASASPIALSHILQFSQSFKIGLGDAVPRHATVPDAIQWEDLRRSTFTGAEHRWGMSLAVSDSKARDGRRRLALLWKRTRSVRAQGAEDGIRHRGFRGWKLLDEEQPDEVLAVFTLDQVFGRRGVLQINADYGDEFTIAVLMTLLTLYERSEMR